MKARFRQSFLRDIKKIRDKAVLARVLAAIKEVESATDLQQLASLKKISGASGFYRIRAGDYRIGLVLEGDEIEFIRCLHPRDIYRYFP